MSYLIVVLSTKKKIVPVEWYNGSLAQAKLYAQQLAMEYESEILISQTMGQAIRINKPQPN